MTPKKSVIVVVDGSNVATEGRSTPSLAQLDECVRALADEMPGAQIIVVVDATFGHRIDASERDAFKEAELAGEIVTPPAGAVGRGDAFILKIATRASAVVLSNDSFQEFHGEYPWLFDEGRLLGGKPVPGIGWIFTPRNPVKGPTSRAVRAKAASETAAPAPIDAAPAARSPRAAAKATTKTAAKKTTVPKTSAAKKATALPSRAPRASKATVAHPPPAPARAPRTSKKTAGARAAGSAKGDVELAETTVKPARRAAAKAPAASAQAGEAPSVARRSRQRSATPKATEPRVSTAAAAAKRGAAAAKPASRSEPTNSARAFRAFVEQHPLRSRVEGEVTAFTSHGAMVTVSIGRMQVVCYAPLAGLARPKPQRARDVLNKGETQKFRVVAFDADRRIAELSLV